MASVRVGLAGPERHYPVTNGELILTLLKLLTSEFRFGRQMFR